MGIQKGCAPEVGPGQIEAPTFLLFTISFYIRPSQDDAQHSRDVRRGCLLGRFWYLLCGLVPARSLSNKGCEVDLPRFRGEVSAWD